MQKFRKIILFDIDYTIWDTDSFRDSVFPLLAEAIGYSFDEFNKRAAQAEKETKKRVGCFQPDTWLTIIHKAAKRDVSRETLEKIFWTENFYHDALDKETITVLQQLQKKGYTIGIFSTGERTFQQQKIAAIKHLLPDEHVYIFTDKQVHLASVLHNYKNGAIVIVDDLPSVLAAVKQYNPAITTILRLGKKKYEQTEQADFKPDYTITKLNELKLIL